MTDTPAAPPSAPRAVLLDVDGTLVDSNDQHAQAWVDAFAEFGYDVPFDQVRRLIGMGSDKVIPRFTDLDAKSGRGKELAERRSQIFLERHLPTVKGLPQARALLERMRRDGLTLVVATSAKQHEYELLVKAADVGGVVDDQTTSDDASRSKPDPDIVLAALKKADVPAAATIMLGDTPYDVQAARAAGMRAVAFRSGGWTDEDLGDAEAVYADPADLLARYDDSPFTRAPASRTA